jgi:hypothetical protein
VDSLRTGIMTVHTHLRRTSDELDRMAEAVAIKWKGKEMASLEQLERAGAHRVAAVKTSDGQMWEDANQALAHQNNLNFKAAISKFADEHGYSEMGRSGLEDVLLEHADELRAILNSKV